jgi:hypothetical protein
MTDPQIEEALSAYIKYHADLTMGAVNNLELDFFSRDHLNLQEQAEEEKLGPGDGRKDTTRKK